MHGEDADRTPEAEAGMVKQKVRATMAGWLQSKETDLEEKDIIDPSFCFCN